MSLDRQIKTVACATMILSMVSSCASEPGRGNTSSLETPINEMRMIVQVCLPEKAVFFEDLEIELNGVADAKTLREERAANGYPEAGVALITAPITEPQSDPNRVTVRRWIPGSGSNQLKRYSLGFGDVLNQDGIRSAGSGSIDLWNNSEKNQPIFETKGHRLEDTLALSISAEVEGEILTYWYKPPKEIPKNQFTRWQEPISQESLGNKGRAGHPAFWNLTHDKPMEIHPVTGHAPKIRYRLMTVEEYYDQYRFWRRAQTAIGRNYYSNVYGEDRAQLHFVPKIQGVVPGC